jgi:hypothetical protein
MPILPCVWHTVVDLVLVSLFGELGEGASFLLPWGPKIFLSALLLPYPGNSRELLTNFKKNKEIQYDDVKLILFYNHLKKKIMMNPIM